MRTLLLTVSLEVVPGDPARPPNFPQAREWRVSPGRTTSLIKVPHAPPRCACIVVDISSTGAGTPSHSARIVALTIRYASGELPRRETPAGPRGAAQRGAFSCSASFLFRKLPGAHLSGRFPSDTPLWFPISSQCLHFPARVQGISCGNRMFVLHSSSSCPLASRASQEKSR